MLAFASPEVYAYLEAEGYLYAIRLPSDQVLQKRINHLLTRPVGRPSKHVLRYYVSFDAPRPASSSTPTMKPFSRLKTSPSLYRAQS